MTKLILSVKLVVLCCNMLFANVKNISRPEMKSSFKTIQEEKINIIFQNNDGLNKKATPQKYKLTIEDLSGNKTIEEFSLGIDSRRKTIAIGIGSKIYIDNGYKLNTLGGGKSPDKSDPFMTVMLRDRNQTINLNEELVATEAIVLSNAQKSADKLKLDSNLTKEIYVTGNIATVYYKNESGKIKAGFDCDKKSGNVKNIDDRKNSDDQGPAAKAPTKDDGVKKLKGLFGK
jgi:hypothetical protein